MGAMRMAAGTDRLAGIRLAMIGGRTKESFSTAASHGPPRPHWPRLASTVRGPGVARAGRVRGFLFELDDVLHDATLWRRWLLTVLSRLGLPANYRTFYRPWDRDYLPDVHRGRRAWDEAFQAFLLEVGLSHGQIDQVEAASHARQRELDSTIHPLPGVRQTLARLAARGLALGVLANAELPAAVLQERLARLGLEGRFQVVVSSFDLGSSMPDEACYHAGLTAIGLTAVETAFVGHDTRRLAGAAAAGMCAVALNHASDALADIYLERFADLAELLTAGDQPIAGHVCGGSQSG
jgi:HAD superfamily hydrolase (TIGR01509 family)